MAPREKPIVDLTAHCACGRVTLAVRGRIRSMFMCSCEDCQRATGTGHSTVALASPADVTISGPTRNFARPAHSGASLTRWFCPECGTPLYAQSSRAPDLLMLAVGLAIATRFVTAATDIPNLNATSDAAASSNPHQTSTRRSSASNVAA